MVMNVRIASVFGTNVNEEITAQFYRERTDTDGRMNG